MRHAHRRAGLLLAGMMTLAGLILGSGTAGAAPELPRLAVTGDAVPTLGDHAGCRGVLRTSLTAVKPGLLRVRLTSAGFTGDGRNWARDPICRVLIGYTWTSGRTLRAEAWQRAAIPARPGYTLTLDIPTGPGLVALVIGTYAPNTPVRVPLSPGTSFYVVV